MRSFFFCRPLTEGKAIAERALCALLTELIYTYLPVGKASTTWTQYVVSWVGLALAWDFYFFVAHRAFHLNKRLYVLFHKTHHTYKDPNCFTAYYVSYCSHLITEQLFVMAAALVCPGDVLIHYLYYGGVSDDVGERRERGESYTSDDLPVLAPGSKATTISTRCDI